MKAKCLIEAYENSESCWNSGSVCREDILEGITNPEGLSNFVSRKFESLPEVIKTIISLRMLSNKDLNDLAVKEGFLDLEARAGLTKENVILLVAGSLNRGATAETTSSFKIGRRS